VSLHHQYVLFRVPGEPVPQGSMWSPKGSTAVLHSKRKSKRGAELRSVAHYRKAVQHYASRAMLRRPLFDGAVTVSVLFYLSRPVSRPRSRFRYPDRKPDLDKLERALGDALEKVVVTQDSRIVEWHACKRYADDQVDHDAVPCTVVTMREVSDGKGFVTVAIEEGEG